MCYVLLSALEAICTIAVPKTEVLWSMLRADKSTSRCRAGQREHGRTYNTLGCFFIGENYG